MSTQQILNSLLTLDQLHQDMISVGEMKRTAIIKNDIDKLIEVMNAESRIVKQIEKAESERITACQLFLQDKGIKSQLDLSITELSRLVFDPEEKKSLLEVQGSLSHTLEQLKKLNDLNQKLIEQSLLFIDYSLDLLGGRDTQEATYHHPADKSGGVQRSGLFDTRA